MPSILEGTPAPNLLSFRDEDRTPLAAIRNETTWPGWSTRKQQIVMHVIGRASVTCLDPRYDMTRACASALSFPTAPACSRSTILPTVEPPTFS